MADKQQEVNLQEVLDKKNEELAPSGFQKVLGIIDTINKVEKGDFSPLLTALKAKQEQAQLQKTFKAFKPRLQRIYKQDPERALSLQAIAQTRDIKEFLKGLRSSENTLRAERGEKRIVAKEKQLQNAKNKLLPLKDGLSGGRLVRFNAKLAANDISGAAGVAKEAESDPSQDLFLIRAGARNEVDIQDKDDITAFLIGKGLSENRAESIAERFQRRVLKKKGILGRLSDAIIGLFSDEKQTDNAPAVPQANPMLLKYEDKTTGAIWEQLPNGTFRQVQ